MKEGTEKGKRGGSVSQRSIPMIPALLFSTSSCVSSALCGSAADVAIINDDGDISSASLLFCHSQQLFANYSPPPSSASEPFFTGLFTFHSHTCWDELGYGFLATQVWAKQWAVNARIVQQFEMVNGNMKNTKMFYYCFSTTCVLSRVNYVHSFRWSHSQLRGLDDRSGRSVLKSLVVTENWW